jgi:HSP20 family protein
MVQDAGSAREVKTFVSSARKEQAMLPLLKEPQWELTWPESLHRFRREMDNWFGRFLTNGGGEERNWFALPVNVAESENAFEVSVDLPGFKADEVNVELHDGVLNITGERRHESQEEGKTWHRVERRYGQFQRSVNLGHDVDANKVQAHYKDGVLNVTVPKSEASKPKKISVKAE